jgi:signal transduction histidine kinase
MRLSWDEQLRAARAAIESLRPVMEENRRLREALHDAREALALGAAIPPSDEANRDAVIRLGERIG